MFSDYCGHRFGARPGFDNKICVLLSFIGKYECDSAPEMPIGADNAFVSIRIFDLSVTPSPHYAACASVSVHDRYGGPLTAAE
jgi:hypothetical protein